MPGSLMFSTFLNDKIKRLESLLMIFIYSEHEDHKPQKNASQNLLDWVMHYKVDIIVQQLKFTEQRQDAHMQNLEFTDSRLKLTTSPHEFNDGITVSRTTKTSVWFSVGVIQKAALYGWNTKQKWKYSVMPQGIHILNTAHNQDVSSTTGSETRFAVEQEERPRTHAENSNKLRHFSLKKKQQSSNEQGLWPGESVKRSCPLLQHKRMLDEEY